MRTTTAVSILFLALVSSARASPPDDHCPLGFYLPTPPVACVPMKLDGEICYDPDGHECCSRVCDWDVNQGNGKCVEDEQHHHWECH